VLSACALAARPVLAGLLLPGGEEPTMKVPGPLDCIKSPSVDDSAVAASDLQRTYGPRQGANRMSYWSKPRRTSPLAPKQGSK
jgi:hypothetical protein